MIQPGTDPPMTESDFLLKNNHESDTRQQHEEEEEEGNPFTFTPQLIHLHRDHELFEEGDVQRHMYLQDLYIPEAADHQAAISVSEFACHIAGCSAVHSTLEEYEHHYNSLHRNVCCSCRRSLPTARLLDIHIQEWHDSLFTILAQRQDMYQCLVEGCDQKFRTSKHRKDHLIKAHKYPPDFRFDKPKKDKGTRDKKQQQEKDAAMEVADDVCEAEGVCEVLCDSVSAQPEQEESMDTQVPTGLADITAALPSNDERVVHSAASHDTTNTADEALKARYSYRVPATVCFGHGSVRGFKGRRGRRK